MKKVYKAKGHSVTAVKVERISNGAIAVHLRCCGNPSTDHPHTMYRLHLSDTATIDKKLAEAAKDVADQHASVNAAHKYITENFLDEKATLPHAHVTTMELK